MIQNTKLARVIHIITKIFLIGLLLQFFLQTFVTYKLGFTGILRDIVRMRKEIIIIWLLGATIYLVQKHKLWSPLRKKIPIKGFIIIFAVTLLVTFCISTFINHTPISTYIMSIRYSMMGFLIFIIFFVNSYILEWEKETSVPQGGVDTVQRYTNGIKKILFWAIIRRGIIWLVPRTLEFAGYSKYTYEGNINSAPPTNYYTQYNEGYVRNQFLFERPITFWFFLVMFWPLFFIFTIRNRWRKNAMLRWSLYGLMILSTFSRAARAAWFALTIILIITQYQKRIFKIAMYTIIPLLLIFWTVTYIGRDQIIARQFSNTGHFKMIMEAITKIKEKPLWWQWAGSAWPASHHLGKGKEYNPENQFLQIWLEYGIIGFIGRMLLYCYLMKIGYSAYHESIDPTNVKKNRFYWAIVFAFSLGLVGISIQWLVLHSFVDRMIVYPYTALFGMAYAIYCKSLNSKKEMEQKKLLFNTQK